MAGNKAGGQRAAATKKRKKEEARLNAPIEFTGDKNPSGPKKHTRKYGPFRGEYIPGYKKGD